MENFDAATTIQDLQFFGEFGGVNPSISDSSTYTFLSAKSMVDTFEGTTEGCYLYSRHTSPSNLYLSQALAQMENTESANVTASGMGAITAVLLQLCKTGDHIVSSRTIYGGTYAFMKNFLPGLDIQTDFVDINNLAKIEESITPKTKVIFCESVSNPLLEIADIEALAKIAKKHNVKLIVDNTFSPLSLAPKILGADVVIHSLTKFINGSSDAVGGVVCGTTEFINDLKDVNSGACMLLGSTLDESLIPYSLKKDDCYLALVKSGISSNVLLNRPDIKELEYQLRAKNANIGAARAAFFPTISLTANTGYSSSSLNNLFSTPNSFWQISPSINLPIFTAGENSAKLDLSETQKEIALNEYQKGIQTAFKEVNDALMVRKNIYTKLQNQKELTASIEDAYNIALNSYKIGYGSYLNMLIAQKAYINSQKTLTQTYLEELENRVEIFKTLGGEIE